MRHQALCAAALLLLSPAAAAQEEDAVSRYNAACLSALAGEKEGAFTRLEGAVALGFGGCAHMAEDPDLASLHAVPRWAKLLARCGEAKGRAERFWDGPAWRTPFAESLSEADRVAGLSRLWSEAKFSFANFALVEDLDWDAAYRDAIPKALAARTTADFYRVLQELVAKLRDGHSSVTLPKELRDRMLAWPAITTRVAGGRVLVAELLDPSLAALGVRPGLEITAVDGVPVLAYAAGRVAPAVAASTPQDREVRTFERHLLDGAAGEPVRLALADASGGSREVALPRLASSERSRLRPARPLAALEPLGGGLVHVTIRSFNDPKVVAEFDALRPAIAASRGLVLDLRENGGGNSAHGDRILASLAKGTFASQRWWTRDYRPAMRAWGSGEAVYARTDTLTGAPFFDGPAVLLVGPRTYSAAEDFTAAFRDAGRGRIVGEPTGGSTGQPLRFALPGGGTGQVCAKRNTLGDGTEFVGIGIAPDVLVRTTFDDLRAGRDPVLERAVRLLSE